MQFGKRLVLTIPLAVLLFLLNIYGDDLYHWITGDYLATIEKSVPYKLLLQVCLGIASGTLVCLALLFLYIQKVRSLSKVQTNQQSQTVQELKSDRIEMLQHLSGDEKELLRSHFDQDKTCLKHPEKGAALSLITKGVLYAPSQHYDPAPMGYDVYMQYCVSEWAWVHLKKHPALLEQSQTTKQIAENELQQKHLRVIQNLSRDEKSCLRQCYIAPGNKVWVFREGDPTPMGLVDQNVLYTSSRMDISLNLNFHIQLWAWEMLRANPKLLD